MTKFIEIIKDNGQRLLLNTNNIISIYDMCVKSGSKVMINTINESGELVQFETSMRYDDIKSQL
ncbi:hypothetical protein [Psychrobacter namhaensis]|uniref:hypothetical protein n=1 Tax=Psychrobacter namhaensis TaxID=292734 RepID=UPI0018DF191C|nr:hypothetical protein [Psychrobacter namhaensis]